MASSMDDEKITYFAETDARNRRTKFGIKAKDRSRHMYVIGKTGMGKSTLLENLAIQDIQSGNGIAFIDPHGKTADLLLEYVPEHRIKDVLYFAPFDMDYPVSFNVMEDVGPDKRHLVSNGLMSAFKKIWVDAWSARMEYILNNILLALLEYPDSTLIGVNRMLADEAYREKVVANITDPSVKSFWADEFAKYGPRYMQEAGAAIQNKIGQFISNPLVRNIIGQPKSTFDIRKMMDDKKILIINLSKGRVGEANANLLGSMLITKIYLAAMSRADLRDAELAEKANFYLYVDEFQNFANESFADILSEARKYKLNLTVAHQYIEQMTEEVRAAVFGNVGSMVVFRVGAYDAEVLEKEFSPQFTMDDLVSLGFAQIYLKLMIDGVTSKPFSATTLPPVPKPPVNNRDAIIAYSRKVNARPRAEVEEEIMRWHQESQAAIAAAAAARPPRGMDRGDRGGDRSPRNFSEGGAPRKTAIESALEAVLGRPASAPPRHSAPQQNSHSPRPHSAPVSHPNLPRSEAHTPKEDAALQREKELRKAVSLSYLRQNNPKPKEKKAPSEEHLADLRAALAAVTGDIIKDNVAPVINERAEVHSSEEPTQSIPPPPPPKREEPKSTKEVPEDVLKRILQIE